MNTTVGENAVSHAYTPPGAVQLHYAEAGTGPLVVLLHGFPEAWFSYRYQLSALAGAGFHAVAPDMRGYNLSDKPRGVRAYTLKLLTGDVARLIHACGEERVAVVGHDWGALVAWNFTMRYPEMVDRLVILNVPHPSRMGQALRTMPRQMLKSWYVLFFQLPWLPEWLFRAGNYAILRRTLLHEPIRPGTFSPDDVERYVEAMSRPGALTGGINHYRALARYGQAQMREWKRPIDAPTLVIWGDHDHYLESALADPGQERVRHYRVKHLPNASHWVQNDRPEEVNQMLIDFLRG